MNDDKLQFLFILNIFFKTMIKYNKKQWNNMQKNYVAGVIID